ncbi:PREDICTED: pro-resilin [Nicrophorus vespilloides]|uniref:Pro-resilin n=1 Tax=Nicrophorus vespilloides TaxID=110193 RepID=A0ABM1NDD7_NICVS|nr:PREDICTED: pro-resilin [Nicrophorus vespilloides]XP_017784838.1 PREDICTED: pro-resilin [Nicrophorus vespilloides]
MKVFLVFASLAAVVLAEPPAPSSQYLPSNQYGPPSNQYGPPSNQYGPPSQNYGAPGQTQAVIRPSNQYGAPRPGGNYLPPNNGGGNGGYGYGDQSEPANYNFKYDVQDAASGNDFGHEEARQGDVARGKYYVLLPDGRRQVVEYVADNEGYKPKISYEQVGNGYGNGGYQNGGYPSGNNGGYQY